MVTKIDWQFTVPDIRPHDQRRSMATHAANSARSTPSSRPSYNVGQACRGIGLSIAVIIAVIIALLLI